MNILRACSTRAKITSTKFINFYNWGTHEFMLRLTCDRTCHKIIKNYCIGDSARVWRKGNVSIINLFSDDETGDDWFDDGRRWLSSLLPLREDILNKDYRALYIASLQCVQAGEILEDQLEPPVPPGLKSLTAPLRALVRFLRIDKHLLEAASQSSAPLQKSKSRKVHPGAIERRSVQTLIASAQTLEETY